MCKMPDIFVGILVWNLWLQHDALVEVDVFDGQLMNLVKVLEEG